MDFKEQVRAASNIARVIGDHIRLQRAGAGRWKGLCPFHQEKTPSFNVNEDNQFYHCFGCKASGDVFKFIQEIEGVSFFEALQSLAERSGIPMPKRRDLSDAETDRRMAIFRMYEIAGEHYRGLLRSAAGAEARAYLEKRGANAEAIETFGLGYSDRGGGSLLRKLEQGGFSAELIEASRLVNRRDSGGYYDFFRHRVMFPIHNESGKLIAFGGRAMGDEDPKYLNSPDSPIYTKKQVLYNLNRARQPMRQSELVVLVEGYMDVIGIAKAGVGNVVAPCGTALTPEQVRMLRRHTERIVVNFDPDRAGHQATERSIPLLLQEGFHIRVLNLDDGLDPDEYVERHGAEAYRARLEKADGYFHWLASRTRERFDNGTAESRMEGYRRVLRPVIALIPDRLERLAVANEVAHWLGVDPAEIREQLRREMGSQPVAKASGNPLSKVSDAERTLVRGLIEEPRGTAEVAEFLRGHEVVSTLATGGILHVLGQLLEAGVEFSYADVEARLNGPDRELLAALVLGADMADKGKDRQSDEGFSPERAWNCLQALDQVWRKRRLTELDREIKAAEQRGDMPEAMKLMGARKDIERQRWRAGRA